MEYTEGIAIQLFDRRTNYYCAQAEKDEWYVMSKFYFSNDCATNEYTNVHCVEINREECTCLCSCPYKRRSGCPCVHVMAVMNCFHHEMFHPRFYKVYNSSLSMKVNDVRDSLNLAHEKCKRRPDVVTIESSINEFLQESVIRRNGCNDLILSVMKKVWKRHKQSIITSKNDVIKMVESPVEEHECLFEKNDHDI